MKNPRFFEAPFANSWYKYANTATATGNAFLLRIVFGQSCFDLSSFCSRLSPGSLCSLSQVAGVQVKSSCLRKKCSLYALEDPKAIAEMARFTITLGSLLLHVTHMTYIFKKALHIFKLSVLRQSSATSCLRSANDFIWAIAKKQDPFYTGLPMALIMQVVPSGSRQSARIFCHVLSHLDCVEDKVLLKCLQGGVPYTATKQLRDPAGLRECTADFFLPKHALVNSSRICFCISSSRTQ